MALLPNGLRVLKPSLRRIPSRAPGQEELPHVVKFSGGRSSAALTYLLAENGLLRPERGDVILFANTSAEHPGTYQFARRCKTDIERQFGIPFFWFEFCTVEDASRGAYVRRPSYRLVRPSPVEEDPDGYRSKGEVFEELLSYQGMLPSPHRRSCTTKLKLYPSHALLADWLGRTPGPGHAGHYGGRRYVTTGAALAQYRRNGGLASDEAYRQRVRYMTMQPAARPAQRWEDYTDATIPERSKPYAPASMWGTGAAEHVTLLGLRSDEDKRIAKVMSRSIFAEGAGSKACEIHTQPPGEHPCFPLADWEFDGSAVHRFWNNRDFDLEIPPSAGNCVFCFMKGTRALSQAARQEDPQRQPNTPSDISWWIGMERQYRREVPSRDSDGISSFGFFGLRGPEFADIARGTCPDLNRYSTGTPACDCTD